MEPGVTGGFDITPSDTVDLPNLAHGLLVGVAGAVKVTFQGGAVLVIPLLAAGAFHKMKVKRVWATGTTATGIVGASA